MLDIVKKIDKMRVDRGWTIYKLSQEANISQQTFHTWLETDTMPSVNALLNICEAFNITIADLFADYPFVELTPELQNLYQSWIKLTKDEQKSIINIIENFNKNKG